MSPITGDFVASIAQAWHRMELSSQDAESLAAMLVPMDAAGESLAQSLDFDSEPAAFYSSLEALAPGLDRAIVPGGTVR